MRTVTFHHVDPDRLESFAEAMVQCFDAPLVVGLVGTLGAGKTTLTQSIAVAAGIDRDDVNSPTFTLLCSYRGHIAGGPITLHHLDAYRVGDEDEFLELGIEELFETPDAWVWIEWAGRFESLLPPETLWIRIEVGGTGSQKAVPQKAVPQKAVPQKAVPHGEPPRTLHLQTVTDRWDAAVDHLVDSFPRLDPK
jgi:tRNA threonylcarbamoyladenosine biosynthesis protein TsaE